MLKFGIEVEFACHNSKWSEIHHAAGYDTNYQFEIGFDSSAAIMKHDGKGHFLRLEGYELRTFGTFTTFPDSLKEVLRKLKLAGAIVHSTCGFHIHFSGIPIDFEKLRDKIHSEQLNWKSRSEYCTQITCFSTEKYQPVRRVMGDHYEVRAFNSTLSFRGLKKMFELAVQRIEDAKI